METAKIFENGKSQAVRLPKKFRFISEEVYIQRPGDAVMLVPKEASWRTFLNGIDGFSNDFLESGRCMEILTEEEHL